MERGGHGCPRELYDPDAILRIPEGWPEPGPFVGREAVMRRSTVSRDLGRRPFEPISDFIDVGDRVAVRFIWRARATALSRTSS